jgi:hypothetical protein
MERRAHERIPHSLLLNAWEDGLPTLCELEDLSESGLRLLRLGNPRRLGSAGVVLEVEASSGPVLKLCANRVREEGRRFAVHFAELSEAQSQAIRKWVSSANPARSCSRPVARSR